MRRRPQRAISSGLRPSVVCPAAADLLFDFPLRVHSEVVVSELRCCVQQSAIQRQTSGARRESSSTRSRGGVSDGAGHGIGKGVRG